MGSHGPEKCGAHTPVHFWSEQHQKDVLSFTLRLQWDLFKSHPEQRCFLGITPREISAGSVLFSARHKPDVLHGKWLSGFLFLLNGLVYNQLPARREGHWQREKDVTEVESVKKKPNKLKILYKAWDLNKAERGKKCAARRRKALRCTSGGKKGFIRHTKRNWRQFIHKSEKR